MKKLVVFPFTYEYRELVMYSTYLKEYELIACVTLNQVDSQCITKELDKDTEVIITDDFEQVIDKCDAVLCLYDKSIILSQNEYLQRINRAIELNKEILISKGCRKYLKADSPLGVTFIDGEEEDRDIVMAESSYYLKNIDIPSIGIMGLGEYCNKFCTELEVGEYFRKLGYKVLQFGSKDYIGLYGGKALPGFLFDEVVPVTMRILKWNQYLFDICNTEKPDLIVIGMPGGIMPLNNKILNDFGEIPFILSNGIRMDVGILCSFFYEKVDKKYFNKYENYCKYKLNCEVGFINMSNTSCRFNLDSQESTLEYLHYENEIPNKTVITGTGEKVQRVYNILDDNSRDELLSGIYSQLTSGVSAF